MNGVSLIMKMFVELLWSIPVVALIIGIATITSKRPARCGFPLLVVLCVLFGIAYAVALALLAGPMVSAFIIPLLPFMAAVSVCAAFLKSLQSRKDGLAAVHAYIVIAVIVIVWGVYAVLARRIAAANAVCLVVVKRVRTPGLTRWDSDDQSITLSQAEQTRVQQSVSGDSGSILKPIFSFEEGQHPRAKVILIMIHDVRNPMWFSMPDSGVEILRQNQDDTWQSDLRGSHTGNSKLGLSPAGGAFTRIEIAGPFERQSSEVEVSRE